MKTVTAILVSSALAGLSVAQLQGLPVCAQDCANKFLIDGIGDCGRDPKCICENKSFIGDISCCLAKPSTAGGGNPDEQQKAIVFASQICAAQGVVVPGTVSCSTVGTTSPTPTGSAPTGSTPTGSAPTGSAPTNAAQTGQTTTNKPNAAAAPRETGMAAIVGGLVMAALL